MDGWMINDTSSDGWQSVGRAMKRAREAGNNGWIAVK